MATVFAGDGLELGEAAKAAPQINNDTASIADADANRVMSPASLELRAQANAPDYAWAMWGMRLLLPRFSARVEIAAAIAYFIGSTGK